MAAKGTHVECATLRTRHTVSRHTTLVANRVGRQHRSTAKRAMVDEFLPAIRTELGVLVDLCTTMPALARMRDTRSRLRLLRFLLLGFRLDLLITHGD